MIKFLVMDVDGSLTDGKLYIGPEGEAMKAFSVKDGYAINFILKPVGIVPVIITARSSKIVQNRCDELGIKEVHQGTLDKLATLKEIVGEENIGKCAYFGDDIIDLKCMLPIQKAGGLVGCPENAVQEVKAIADYICNNKSGEGALREFAEWVVSPRINYCEIEKRVHFALEYLKEQKQIVFDEQKHIVDDNFYYFTQSYIIKCAREYQFESHKKYVEIQIIVKGTETIDLADISRLTLIKKYQTDKDVMFWSIPEKMAHVTLREGDSIILYPENAHRERIAQECQKEIVKIIGKVKII